MMPSKLKLSLTVLTAFFVVQAHADTRTEVICSYAPSQSASVAKITASLGGAGVGVVAIMQAAGLTAVAHSSGLYILTGAGGYIAGTIGGAVVAPIVVTASVVTAAGAVTLEMSCAPKNHPDAVKNVKTITDRFVQATKGKLNAAQSETVKQIKELNAKGVELRDDAGIKIQAANQLAIEVRDNAIGYARANMGANQK